MTDLEKKVVIGFLLTVALFLFIPIYVAREPVRMKEAAARQRVEEIERGAHRYESFCRSCHGTDGQGGLVPDSQPPAAAPALNRREFREGDPEDLKKIAESLQKTIARGRPGTKMPPWGLDDGGAFNKEQIYDLTVFIQYGDWKHAAASVPPAAATPAPQPTQATVPGAPTPSLVEVGQKLVRDKGCLGCHKLKGEGGSVAPDLTTMASRPQIAGVLPNSAENMRKWLQDPPGIKPGTAMPRLPLTPQELDALVSYLETLKPSAPDISVAPAAPTAAPTTAPATPTAVPATPTTAPPAPPPTPPAAPPATADVEKGKSLYSSKGCIGCHGPDGAGTALAPTLKGKTAETVRGTVRSGKGMMPPFPAAQLSDADLEDIIQYLGSLGR